MEPCYSRKKSACDIESGTARSADQCLTHQAIKAFVIKMERKLEENVSLKNKVKRTSEDLCRAAWRNR